MDIAGNTMMTTAFHLIAPHGPESHGMHMYVHAAPHSSHYHPRWKIKLANKTTQHFHTASWLAKEQTACLTV